MFSDLLNSDKNSYCRRIFSVVALNFLVVLLIFLCNKRFGHGTINKETTTSCIIHKYRCLCKNQLVVFEYKVLLSIKCYTTKAKSSYPISERKSVGFNLHACVPLYYINLKPTYVNSYVISLIEFTIIKLL